MDHDDREPFGTEPSPPLSETAAATPPEATGEPAGASAGASAGSTRSQNVVYTLPHDWRTIPQFLAPALERLAPDAVGTQLLVVTPDAETALAVAEAGLPADEAARPTIFPVTSPARAERVLRARATPAVAGSAEVLVALVRSAALKLDAVRALVLAWPDDAADDSSEALEAVLAEVPKEAARVLVVAEATPDVEALIERYLRRARRVAPPFGAEAAAGEAPIPLAYVTVAPAARAAALRRLLDELNPASAAVVTYGERAAAEATRAVRALGYATGGDASAGGTAQPVTVVRGDAAGAGDSPMPNAELVVLYELPSDRASLDRATSGRPRQVVALAQPRQLGALARIAGAPPRALVLGDAVRQARARDDAMRAELRAALERGGATRELFALEPLLAEWDGVEIAAAALRLLERARATPAAEAEGAAGGRPVAAAPNAAAGMTRLFVTIGARDGVRPGDLVGAIASEGGITSERIGKIEVRDTHSLVEVASADAARVAERVNGMAIRGRRVVVRPDREGREGGEGREGREGRGERPPRPGGGGARGERPQRFDRADRPNRPARERGDREPRGERPAGREPRSYAGGRGGAGGAGGGPRGLGAPDTRDMQERTEQRGEWAARGERLRRARRGSEESDLDPGADAARGERLTVDRPTDDRLTSERLTDRRPAPEAPPADPAAG